MRVWWLGALALIALLGGCSSNSTPVAVTITTTAAGASTSSITIIESTSAQFEATVSGASSNIVFWQICLNRGSNTSKPPVPPSDCTQGVGPTQCNNIPTVKSPITGYGTITLNGLYTAPPAPPAQDAFYVIATSCVDTTRFGFFQIIVDSGIRVTVSPTTATIGETQQYQFNATVTGTNNLGVSWELCTSGANGPTDCQPSSGPQPPNPCMLGPNGCLTSSGLYVAPATTAAAIIEAISAADQNQIGTASVSVVANSAPSVSAIDPLTAAQGSAQQDVYLTGTNFFTNSTVTANGVVLPLADVDVISTTLVRATIPAAELAQGQGTCSSVTGQCTIQIGVQNPGNNNAAAITLNLVPVRPGLIGELPQSVIASNTSTPTIILTGGFFSPQITLNGNLLGTTATFNGQSVPATLINSRQLSLALPAGAVANPGLYPIVVQNAGIPAGQPSSAAINLGVTPALAATGGATGSIGVGTNPSAIAIDEADGIAVVANTGSNSVSLINLASNTVSATITVGNAPTGVAVDDLLATPIALVVNSLDQSVSTINLKTATVVGAAFPISIGPINTSPVPFSIGVNPVTHRALVAYQSTNQATVFDVSTGTPANAMQIAATAVAAFGTGPNPAVAIDPQLNWAVVTPGGAGAVNLVDLGLAANTIPGFAAGRQPQVIGSISISASIQGVGINPETHEALLTNPQTGAVTEFSLLNYAVQTVTQGASNYVNLGASAAAATAFENVAIAVAGSSAGSSAAIVDLVNGEVLQTLPSSVFPGGNLQAVAVDPATNQALAVDEKNGLVYFIPLGPAITGPQIVSTSPAVVFGGPTSAAVTLTINGSGFTNTSEVLLDGTSLASLGGTVTFNSARQIVATVPGGVTGPLAFPRRYALQVENGAAASNVTGLEVVQAVPVGNAPVGVAIDTDRNMAVVTNSGDNTISLVALSTQTPTGPSQSANGFIGVVPNGTLTVGTTPAGVAAISRLGLALVADNGSNGATLVDVTQNFTPVDLCATPGCAGNQPIGVAIDSDSATGFITDANLTSPTSPGAVATVTGITPGTTTGASPGPPHGSPGAGVTVDHNPVAVALDTNPLFPFAAVATDSSASTLDFLDMSKGNELVQRTSGFSNPTGIVFDPVNQVFLVANSLQNQVAIIDPATFLGTPVAVGIGPTSLDYDFQTSTLVTANSISNTMSVLSYVCPPTLAAPACVGPQVSTVLGLGGTQATVPIFGPNAVAVDPMLSLAVLVDEDNNQVLLIPLPY